MPRHGHPRSERRRRRLAGWLVPLYVLVFISTSLHLAVVDHHPGPHGADHACGQDDHAHHHASAASLAAEAPGDHCCHHLHDALPGKTLQPTLDALKHAAWRRAPEAQITVALVPPRPPRRTQPPVVAAEVRSGVTTVAAGRAPPASTTV